VWYHTATLLQLLSINQHLYQFAMKKNPDNMRIKANAGFSIIDIMVGMVIALLGIIIIFQVFSVSESIKRTTTSGGDALQNGTLALFTLENSLKQAGYGIFSSTNLPPLPADPAGTAPVAITAGVANTSDSLVLTYRPSSGANSWDYGPFPPNPTGFPLIVIPGLTFETISANNQAQLVSTINNVASVISDGIALMKVEYGVDANGSGMIGDGVTNLNGVVEPNEWTPATPALNASAALNAFAVSNPMSVLAVRIVVVARSAQPEVTRGATGLILPPAQCATTTVFPTWIDSATVPLDLSAGVGLSINDSWMCYRYKTFENTVPIRR
jgi:hypothetical protein